MDRKRKGGGTTLASSWPSWIGLLGTVALGDNGDKTAWDLESDRAWFVLDPNNDLARVGMVR
jgi:hypothetical protein